LKQLPSIISADPSAAPLTAADATDTEEGADLGEASELRAFAIGIAQHAQRLDRALAVLVPEFSRSYLQQLIDAGAVVLQGRVVTKASATVHAGQLGQVELRPTPQSQAFKAEPMAIRVVHEDAHLRVIDKPAGLVVHPAPGHWSGTLLNGLLALDPQAALLPRAGIVHRLDRDTSGLMVVARTRATMDALVQMIAARDVSRQYLAMGTSRGRAQRHGRSTRRSVAIRATASAWRSSISSAIRARRHARWSSGSMARPMAARCAARWRRGGPTRSGCTWRRSGIHWWAMRSTAGRRQLGWRAKRCTRSGWRSCILRRTRR